MHGRVGRMVSVVLASRLVLYGGVNWHLRLLRSRWSDGLALILRGVVVAAFVEDIVVEDIIVEDIVVWGFPECVVVCIYLVV